MPNPLRHAMLRSLAGASPSPAPSGNVDSPSSSFIDSTPIRHRAYDQCERTIAALHRRRVETGIGGCASFVGPSGSGKTMLQKRHVAACNPQADNRDTMRVLRAVVPSKPTVKNVVTELLHASGHPSYVANESESLKTIRLLSLMKDRGTEVVMLDEMTNVHDQANDNVEHELTDWLKNFIDSTRCLVVLCGLPRIDRLLRRNNQLRRRISRRTEMLALNMKSEENWTEVRDVLRELHRRTTARAIPFDGQILARRFYFASAGLMDYLVRIATSAADIARAGDTTIDVNVLAEAFVEQVWPDCPEEINPFLVANPDELRMLDADGEPFAGWGL